MAWPRVFISEGRAPQPNPILRLRPTGLWEAHPPCCVWFSLASHGIVWASSGALTPPIGRGDNPTAGTRSVKERFFLGGKVRGVAECFAIPGLLRVAGRRSSSMSSSLYGIGCRPLLGFLVSLTNMSCLFVPFGKRLPSFGGTCLEAPLGPRVEARSFKWGHETFESCLPKHFLSVRSYLN